MTILALPDGLLASQVFVLLSTWFGAGLVEPLRAGLAVASLAIVAALPVRSDRMAWTAITVVLALAGSWAAHVWGTTSGLSDDRRIVIDEVAGFAAAMAVAGAMRLRGAIAVAILFLTLDRLKPWPFDRIEAVPGGLGVMLDDIVLGLALGAAIFLFVRLRAA
jgi:phosphatidylglycerophosphatase A